MSRLLSKSDTINKSYYKHPVFDIYEIKTIYMYLCYQIYRYGQEKLERFNTSDRIDLIVLKRLFYTLKKLVNEAMFEMDECDSFKGNKYTLKINEASQQLATTRISQEEYYEINDKFNKIKDSIESFICKHLSI